MNQLNFSSIESKDLLKNCIVTPIQSSISKIKPCTGFCYYVAQNLNQVIQLYTNKNISYFEFIKNLIVKATIRKKKLKLHEKGEYIDQNTIKNDFPDVYKKIYFKEFACPNEQSFSITQNELFMIFLDVDTNGFIIVTRSEETFIMIKLSQNEFLIVDSHQPIHGTTDLEKATHYILKSGAYKGLVQLGYTKI